MPLYFSQHGGDKVEDEDLKKLQALASLPTDVALRDEDRAHLKGIVEAALKKKTNTDAVKALSDQAHVHRQGTKSSDALEARDLDPAQASLNLQLALSRLVADTEAQEFARLQGQQFQEMFNLTNDQMLTLCRLAVDIGAYKDTDDLEGYMKTFGSLDPVIKSLSPGAVERLGLGGAGGDLCIATCSCCCP
jgi:crotonobetainyl-CoA:carnitine CoA-transferase CaiB-like acyl-CoA transferase